MRVVMVWQRGISAIAGVTLVAAVSLASDARAHLDSLEMLGLLEEQIESRPDDAGLYLRRGDLNVEAHRWDDALLDFERAERLGGVSGAVLDLKRGHVFLSAGWPLTASFYLRRFVDRHGPHARAYLDLARAVRLRGRVDEAAGYYEKSVALTPTPHPDRVIEWARLYADAGRTAQAVAVLDRGVDTIGPVSALHLAALDLELESGHDDRALERLDRLGHDSSRPELWSIRRADLLIEKSRCEQARAELETTLQRLTSRPPHRRNTAAMRDLEQAVRERLSRLEQTRAPTGRACSGHDPDPASKQESRDEW